MNIFVLSYCSYQCALMHCNEHCIKMILEYFQLLSSAHRYLDNTEVILGQGISKRKVKRYPLEDPYRDVLMYKATHINHPCSIWLRQSKGNYCWLYRLTCCLCDEYTRRYGKVHASDKRLRFITGFYPHNIPNGGMTTPPLAMPEEYKTNNIVESYRLFYLESKSRFATWPLGETPWWYKHKMHKLIK